MEPAELVAQACRILGNLNVTHAALGHVSLRLGDSESMLIKGKGPGEVGLRYTQPRDIITVDFSANKRAQTTFNRPAKAICTSGCTGSGRRFAAPSTCTRRPRCC